MTVKMTTMGKKFENRACPIMEMYPQGRLRRQTYYTGITATHGRAWTLPQLSAPTAKNHYMLPRRVSLGSFRTVAARRYIHHECDGDTRLRFDPASAMQPR
jgi:hypothetical protein